MNDKIEKKITEIIPTLNIGKLKNESLINNGIIKSLENGNASAINQVKKDLGKDLFMVNKKI